MPRIRMKISCASADASYAMGQTYDVTPAIAADLCRAGHAEPVKEERTVYPGTTEDAALAPAETAAITPAEKAVKTPKAKRTRQARK